MKRFHKISKSLRSLFLVFVLAVGQSVAAVGPFIHTQPASAAEVCTLDTAGANDVPGQKDLTKLCVDYAGNPTTVFTKWNWDETGTSGANTLDACSLFDTDGDGNINYAVCVTTQGDPATLQTVTTYSCGDDKADRCTSPVAPVSNGTTTCTVSQQNTDPFPAGASYPTDTQGTCTVDLSTVGGASARLVDVCSYPSQQPNSDPSDCVIAQPKAGKLEVKKNLVPATNSGLFNLQVDAITKAANVGNNGTTGEVVVSDGNHSVGETAGTSTSLASYSSSVECRDLNGTGTIIASGTGTTIASVPIADGSDVVCVITNTAAGSITIVKDAVPNSAQDFAFTASGTGTTNFSLDDDSDPTLLDTKTFNNLSAGTFTFTETAVSGWDLYSLSCGQASGVTINSATASIDLSAGQNITCTYTNKKRGTITVHKVTNPANDPTGFQITASGTGNIAGNPVRTLSTAQDVVYDVSQGTYNIAEQLPAGWTLTNNGCASVTVNTTNLAPTCTITNTKYATLHIIKDALPNDPQNFDFTTTNLGGAAFSLDDDSDATLPNDRTFTSLLPGSYSVTEASTPGWSLTGLTCDTNNFSAVGATVAVNLVAGQTTNCTFTNTKLGSIAGTKYTANADSSLGPVLAGWTIYIDLNGNGIKDPGEPTQVTGVDGSYSFTGLLPGTYAVKEVQQAGWTQIFSAAAINLIAGQTSTNNNFGNFQNGSIGGYKFNDLNGNGAKDANEPKLPNWTIRLLNSNNVQINSVATDVNGDYSFTNLAPGTYGVCETGQAGWTQTFPGGNGCHSIIIDISGETNPNINFGNQGRGSIQVIKNVDLNGDGDTTDANETGVTDWTWDIAGGAQNTATGSSQNVAAGSYTVSEDQKTNFHVTSSSCVGEITPEIATTSLAVTVSPGENVVCTFTNTRDTGTITVRKHVINDNGGQLLATSFMLHLKSGGVDVANSPAVGSEAGTVYGGLPTGSYVVSENTPPTGYAQTGIVCDNVTSGSVTLTSNANVICTITNNDIAPRLTVIKHVINDNSGTQNAGNFTMNVTGANVAPNASFPGSETGTTVTINAGSYSVGENTVTGYASSLSQDCTGTIALAQTKTCTITNNDVPHPGIHIVKSGPATAHEGDNITYTFTVTNTGDTALAGTTVVDSITGNAVYVSGDNNSNGLLDRTETWIFTTHYTIPVGQLADVLNTATVCATDPAQTQVCDDDSHTLDVLHPSIMVVKSGPPLAYEGTIVGYNFLVTNTGDTTLTNVGISDDIATSETCLANVLAPAASTTCTAIYLIPIPTTNNVTNIVTASGTDSLGRTVTDTDTHTLDVIHPAIHVVKSGPVAAHEGDTVTYTFTVTNAGDIALSNDTVNDSLAGDATYQSGDTNTNGLLETSETWVFTKQYTIPTPQVANVVNTGTACGTDPLQTQVCDTDNHTLDVLHPAVTVVKSGPATAYEGDTVTYTFVVTNTGDTTLTAVGINDDIATGETCLASTLAPGAFTTCTASYTIPNPQVANVVNTVTACGIDSLQRQVCDTDSHNLDILHPTITINKVVVSSQADSGKFNLQIDSQNKATDVGNGGTTGAVVVTPGSHSVGELAGTATNLSDYVVTMSESCGNGTVNVTGDANVTCTITNTRRASLNIVKNVVTSNDTDRAQDFNFTTTGNGLAGFALDDDSDPVLPDSKVFTQLVPGNFSVTEQATTGWDMSNLSCDDAETTDVNESSVTIALVAGANVTCTFTNTERAKVIVTKYNDLNRNGQFDPNEPTLPESTLPSWTISLDAQQQVTGADGTTTFNNVKPNQIYSVGEVQQTGWHLSDITCDADFEQEVTLGDRLAENLDLVAVALPAGHLIFPRPGQTANCFIGNYHDVVLNIAKTNNRPNPTTVGDTVTYTLLVSLPADSGALFNTTTVDLPPKNFTYVPGSWTAVSNLRGDLKASGITTEPPYGSPGTWLLGNMLPGEIVTLTYRALIASTVSAGTYPDVAFAQGCGLPGTSCSDSEVTFSNLSHASEPFVGTAVAIVGPQVLGASTTVLVNTGTSDILASITAAITLLLATVIIARRRPILKGGKK